MALESLAVLPVITSFVFIFRAFDSGRSSRYCDGWSKLINFNRY